MQHQKGLDMCNLKDVHTSIDEDYKMTGLIPGETDPTAQPLCSHVLSTNYHIEATR